MEILDKTIPTEWAHDAMVRATHALEPLAEPILNSSLVANRLGRRHGTMSRMRGAVSAHPFAVGAAVVMLGAVAFMALRSNGGHEAASEPATSGPQRVRSAA